MKRSEQDETRLAFCVDLFVDHSRLCLLSNSFYRFYLVSLTIYSSRSVYLSRSKLPSNSLAQAMMAQWRSRLLYLGSLALALTRPLRPHSSLIAHSIPSSIVHCVAVCELFEGGFSVQFVPASTANRAYDDMFPYVLRGNFRASFSAMGRWLLASIQGAHSPRPLTSCHRLELSIQSGANRALYSPCPRTQPVVLEY